MNNQLKIPDPQTRRRSVERLREVCRQFDALNLLLDEAKARAEADIRNSPLTKRSQKSEVRSQKENERKL